MESNINRINSLGLDQRINHVDELIKISNDFIEKEKSYEDFTLGSKILDCISGVRASRFIDSDTDLILIETSLKVARKTTDKKHIYSLLKSLLYYANYFPDKFDRDEIEKEIKGL